MAQLWTLVIVQALAIIWIAAVVGCTANLENATTSSFGDVKSEFEKWMRKFGKDKEYGGNAYLMLKRFNAFKANLEHIQQHNQNKSSFTLALNQFADLTYDEVRSTILVGKAPPSEIHTATNQSLVGACYPASLPTNFDWRSRGVVTPVKNQGRCGSCWAFSAVATIESAYAIRTGYLYRLSEQELVSCETTYSYGCQGGFFDYAMLWVRNNGGIDSEADYPYFSGYTGTRGTCDFVKASTQKVAHISEVAVVSTSNEAALQCVLAQQPVAISIYANYDFTQYGGGIFDADTSCPYQPGTANHAITFVGWGQTSSGIKYWIAKNSWGTSWGMNGYIYIRRGGSIPQGVCGVNNYPCIPIV